MCEDQLMKDIKTLIKEGTRRRLMRRSVVPQVGAACKELRTDKRNADRRKVVRRLPSIQGLAPGALHVPEPYLS